LLVGLTIVGYVGMRYVSDPQTGQPKPQFARQGLRRSNSGEVVVRSVGSDLRMDYTAVGQTTHLAARMEQLAPPGTVRLTGETVRLAEDYVETNIPSERLSSSQSR
jgi:class 3 adenylate cyclase